MEVSVVIPTYNRLATLRQTLNALAVQSQRAVEVIVVDDGSTDGTAEAVPAEFPRVAYLSQPNRGPAAARNQGIEAATGEVIAFTDDDCLPPPDWLARLTEALQRLPQVVGAGGPLLAPAALRHTNRLARYEAYVVQQLYGAGEREIVAGFDCPAGGTNNMAYRRAALLAVGKFDQSFPYAAAEDADLKLRLAEAGHLFAYVPVVMTHLQSYTWRAFQRQQYVRGKGRAYFDHKRHKPTGRGLAALRLAAGLARLPGRMRTMPEAGLVLPAMVELWANARGQWAASAELTRRAKAGAAALPVPRA